MQTASTTGVVRARFYIDPNHLSMGELSQVSVLFLINSDAVTTFASMKLLQINGGYYLRGVMIDDNGVHRETAAWQITDEPHYVEIRVRRASSAIAADATYETWIDGVSRITMTGVDSYDKFYDFRSISAGLNGISETVSGTYYVDEIVVNDDGSEIGPVRGATASRGPMPQSTIGNKRGKLVPVLVALLVEWSNMPSATIINSGMVMGGNSR
jgi:hypothetical protein